MVGRPRDGRPARAEGRRATRDRRARPALGRASQATFARRPGGHELREIPAAYGKAVIGWETLPEKLQRENRDLTLADVLRIQHLLGQKPREAGRRPPPDDRRGARSTGGRSRTSPRWSSGPVSTGRSRRPDSERLAAWLGAPYEPFGAHSHYGLVVGEESYVQVADAVRAFLETNRL